VSDQNTVYAEIYISGVASRTQDIVVSGSCPNTGYTLVVNNGVVCSSRFKYCPPVFTDYRQTVLKVDPAIALTNLLWGQCQCGYKVKDFASVIMGHKKDQRRDLICPLCRGTFQVKRCDTLAVGDSDDLSKDVILGGPYSKEAYEGLVYLATSTVLTNELVLPKLWFGYKQTEQPQIRGEAIGDTGDAPMPELERKGWERNRLVYYEFDLVRDLHHKPGAPSVRSVVLECTPHTGHTTLAQLSGANKAHSWCFFRKLYGR